MFRPFLALCALALPAAAQETPSPTGLPWIRPGEEATLGAAQRYAEPGHVIVLIPRVAPGTAGATGAALAARHGAEVAAIWPLASLDETCFVLRLNEDADSAAVSAEVMAEDGVLLAYPIQGFEIDRQSGLRPEDAPPPPFAGEPLIDVQDALRDMRVLAAQAHATGRGVRVALIDSAVAADHPDLADQALETRDFIGDGTLAERHGTALATMIAADGRNEIGMVGVAPDAELLALRACWEEDGTGRCNTFSLALALDYAIMAEADIVNLSLGGPSDRLLEALVGRLTARGSLVVAANGTAPFPASVPGVLVIDGAEAPRSEGVALRAPGRDVLGAEPSGGYDFFTGASVAAAHVSGVAALLWSAAPDALAPEIGAALTARGDPLDACGALGLLAGPEACN